MLLAVGLDWLNQKQYFDSQNLRGRDHLSDIDIDGRVLLKHTLGKENMRLWIGFE